jgi:DNA-binding GntR family transcriptional regulator
MAGPRALDRSVLADQVKERLLEGIISGAYPPDARIIETQVARELHVSQAPVREALRGLEALGVVEITPFKGARVRRPTRRAILEAYEVRSALESLGARLAVSRLTDADIAELVGLGQGMQRAADGGDAHEVAQIDASFHGRILDIADNHTLLDVWKSLEPFLRTYITLVAPGADARWTADLHTPIIAALERRDGDAVVRALQEHFVDAAANMASRWPDGAPAPIHPPRAG